MRMPQPGFRVRPAHFDANILVGLAAAWNLFKIPLARAGEAKRIEETVFTEGK